MSGTITVSNRESVSLFSTQTNLTNRSLGTTRRDGTIALAGELAICANTFAERSSYESILSANARRRPDHLAGRSNAGEQSTDSGTLSSGLCVLSLRIKDALNLIDSILRVRKLQHQQSNASDDPDSTGFIVFRVRFTRNDTLVGKLAHSQSGTRGPVQPAGAVENVADAARVRVSGAAHLAPGEGVCAAG
ncbi:hypothetical protein KL929_003856 [Ogataea haglerorum]|nr:hypothetical protein KL929_003856 [Ogataea haglerorum]